MDEKMAKAKEEKAKEEKAKEEKAKEEKEKAKEKMDEKMAKWYNERKDFVGTKKPSPSKDGHTAYGKWRRWHDPAVGGYAGVRYDVEKAKAAWEASEYAKGGDAVAKGGDAVAKGGDAVAKGGDAVAKGGDAGAAKGDDDDNQVISPCDGARGGDDDDDDDELWEQFCDGGMFEVWGYNISDTHPLKTPFLLYKQMMKDQETDDDDDDADEEEEEEEEAGAKEEYAVRGLCGDYVKFQETFNNITEARVCYENIKKENTKKGGRYSAIQLDDITNEDEPEMIEHEEFSSSEEEEEAGAKGESEADIIARAAKIVAGEDELAAMFLVRFNDPVFQALSETEMIEAVKGMKKMGGRNGKQWLQFVLSRKQEMEEVVKELRKKKK